MLPADRCPLADTAGGGAAERAHGVGLLHSDLRCAVAHARPKDHAQGPQAGQRVGWSGRDGEARRSRAGAVRQKGFPIIDGQFHGGGDGGGEGRVYV